MRCEKCGKRLTNDYFLMLSRKYEITELKDIGYISETDDEFIEIYLCNVCWIEFKIWLYETLSLIIKTAT